VGDTRTIGGPENLEVVQKQRDQQESSLAAVHRDRRAGERLRHRPSEEDWPYLWIDATYLKVREADRIVSVAVIITVAVNTDGVREVLGMAIGPSKAELFWKQLPAFVHRRGLRGVKLVISDAHVGIKAAIAKVLKFT